MRARLPFSRARISSDNCEKNKSACKVNSAVSSVIYGQGVCKGGSITWQKKKKISCLIIYWSHPRLRQAGGCFYLCLCVCVHICLIFQRLGLGHAISTWQSYFSLQTEVTRGATVTHSFMTCPFLTFLSTENLPYERPITIWVEGRSHPVWHKENQQSVWFLGKLCRVTQQPPAGATMKCLVQERDGDRGYSPHSQGQEDVVKQ